MARKGRRAAECAGRGPGAHHDALRESPRAGHLDAQRGGGLSRRRAVSTRQRDAQGATDHLGWPRPCAGCTLHGDPGGDAEESRDSELLSALVSGGEGEEVGVDGLHAEAPHNSQCDGEEWHVVAGGRQSAGLIFKTVADPHSDRKKVSMTLHASLFTHLNLQKVSKLPLVFYLKVNSLPIVTRYFTATVQSSAVAPN